MITAISLCLKSMLVEVEYPVKISCIPNCIKLTNLYLMWHFTHLVDRVEQLLPLLLKNQKNI